MRAVEELVVVPEPSKPRPDHYRVVCISLYREDLDRVDRLVRELRAKGQRRASRSSVIRWALREAERATPGG